MTITVALGTSIPTSITVVATSTWVSPEAKRAIAAAFSAEGICPWRTPSSKPRSSPAASRPASTSAALPCCFSDSATSGQTTNAWRPSRSSRAEQLEGGRAVGLADQPRLHRAAPGRQLAQRRRVEVAVGGQRERAGDRRRGHVEDVGREPRGRLGVERPPLLDPEAVLLVDHADAEPRELDRRLDQRVGAQDQPQLAAGELAQRLLAGRRRRRPGQQRKGDQRRRRAAGRASRRAARRGSRSAPSAPPAAPLRARAASRRGRRRSCPSRPRPSAAAASARPSRGRRRSRRRRRAGRRSARRAATRASARPARPACPAAAPAAPCDASACGRPAPPGRERALRRRAAPAPPRRPPRPRGSGRRVTASATAASPRRARSSAGSASTRFGARPIACSTHSRIR